MSRNKKNFILNTINSIEESHKKYEVLLKKTDITETEKEEKKGIEDNIRKITESVNVIKSLPVKSLIEMERIIHKSNDFVTGLDFTPSFVSSKSYTYSNDTGYSLLVNHTNSISIDTIYGISNITKRVIDDVTNFNGESNLSITRQSEKLPFGGVIHTTPVGNEYIISFEFSLLRFPSKVLQNSLYSHQMKQVTTRRSGLICFNYGTNKSIEFAVMAPQGHPDKTIKDSSKKINTFKNKYSPFSIAVSFPFKGNCSNSIHTDYKFKLNTSYLVKLRITSEDNTSNLIDTNRLRYELFINNSLEEVIFTYGKVWNRNGKKLKESGEIPSQPGFLNVYKKDYNDSIPRFGISKEVLQPNGFDFNTLNLIYSVPYKPLIDYKNISSNDLLKHKNKFHKIIYKRHLHKLNTGVNFGKINIFYSILTKN
jgi:hypothetical protein